MTNSRWWLWSAGFIAVMMILLGVGNLIEDDGGPLYGRILFAAVLIGGAVLIAAGYKVRGERRELGSRLVGIGTLPGVVGMAFFWFPPAVAVGVLALATSVVAFRDADGLTTTRRAPFLAVVAATVVITAIAFGVS